MEPRTVTLVLCDGTGAVLGALPPFPVRTPWWQDVEPILEETERRGLRVFVLRLLSTSEPWPPHGGPVSYLAEIEGRPPGGLTPAAPDPHHPLRMPWARPGSVAALERWAGRALTRLGRPPAGRARQVRAWNLSCLLQVPTPAGPAWVKAVPPFFAHEGAALAALAGTHPDLVPAVLAHEPGRALIDHADGDDLYDQQHRFPAVARRLVDLQMAWTTRVDELLELGLPDRRAGPLVAALQSFSRRADVRAALDDRERAALDRVAREIEPRVLAAGTCGIPDSVVHGDFHPGNWRAVPGGPEVVVDWGDSVIGHPLLEMAWRDEPEREACGAAWRAAVPGCDPEGAMEMLAPVSCLYFASVYQMFLDNIEPSEHCFHRGDPADWIRRSLVTG